MGHVYANITLLNSYDVTSVKKGLIAEEDVKKMDVKALVDSGAMTLTINEDIARQLDLEMSELIEVVLANGSCHKCDISSPVLIRFENRSAAIRALVLPGADEVLLGVIPLKEMDVIIDPTTQQLTVHPDRPHRAQMKVK